MNSKNLWKLLEHSSTLDYFQEYSLTCKGVWIHFESQLERKLQNAGRDQNLVIVVIYPYCMHSMWITVLHYIRPSIMYLNSPLHMTMLALVWVYLQSARFPLAFKLAVFVHFWRALLVWVICYVTKYNDQSPKV